MSGWAKDNKTATEQEQVRTKHIVFPDSARVFRCSNKLVVALWEAVNAIRLTHASHCTEASLLPSQAMQTAAKENVCER